MKFELNNHKIKVLYTKPYYGRVLYVLDIDGEFAYVYKSSGLSGTGHKGSILPFTGLSSRETFSVPYGYIFKDLVYKDRYTTHYKSLSFDPVLQVFFFDLEDFLKDEIKDVTLEHNKEEFKYYVAECIAEMQVITKSMIPFDFACLNIKETK